MLRFDIFGGCVTRDLFEIPSKVGVVGNYFARTSLVSQFSSTLNIVEDDVNLSSKFQKNMVICDLNKCFHDFLTNGLVSDYLILDFLVERFQVIKLNGSFYTLSNEYRKSGLDLGGEAISRDEHLIQFEDVAKKINPLLSKYKKVFINKIYHADSYIDLNGEVRQFKNQKYVERENEFLDSLYSIFQKNVDNLTFISSELLLASESHKWGLATYHFNEDFYVEINEAIRSLV